MITAKVQRTFESALHFMGAGRPGSRPGKMVRSPGRPDHHGVLTGSRTVVTTLLGELSDQAALAGVLNTL